MFYPAPVFAICLVLAIVFLIKEIRSRKARASNSQIHPVNKWLPLSIAGLGLLVVAVPTWLFSKLSDTQACNGNGVTYYNLLMLIGPLVILLTFAVAFYIYSLRPNGVQKLAVSLIMGAVPAAMVFAIVFFIAFSKCWTF